MFAAKGSASTYQCEVRSCNEKKLRSTSSMYINIARARKDGIPRMWATVPFLDMQLSISMLFHILGANGVEDTLSCILDAGMSNVTRLMITAVVRLEAETIDEEALLATIGKEHGSGQTAEKKRRYLEHIVTSEILPHQGCDMSESTLLGKRLFLGSAVRKLLKVFAGELECDDRDHFNTKRIDCAGVHGFFRQFEDDLQDFSTTLSLA